MGNQAYYAQQFDILGNPVHSQMGMMPYGRMGQDEAVVPVGPNYPGMYPGAMAFDPSGLPLGTPGWIPGENCDWYPSRPLQVQQVEPAARLRARCFTQDYVELLGFPKTCVRPCETVQIQTSSPVLFQIRRLHIPDHIAYQLLIHSFKIGKWELIANGQPVPATMFVAQACNLINLKPQTLNPAIPVTITVENISGADVTFVGGAEGIAFEGC